jgi:hypothetical protein
VIAAALIALALAGPQGSQGSGQAGGDGGGDAGNDGGDDAGRDLRADVTTPTGGGGAGVHEAGGTHFRVETTHGPVHVFRPAGYERRTAGVIVYVHGLYTHVDQAWQEHHLAAQFAASGQNALFIAPEAPAATDEEPVWKNLASLIATALRRAHLSRPAGPVIAVGHSGAYRTLLYWLHEPMLRHLILVDALYGNETDFRAWLTEGSGRKMTVVVKGTARWADPFVRSFRRSITLPQIPTTYAALTRPQRTARLLCLRSQYGHMELVTEGRALPILLQRCNLHRRPDLFPNLAPRSGEVGASARRVRGPAPPSAATPTPNYGRSGN